MLRVCAIVCVTGSLLAGRSLALAQDRATIAQPRTADVDNLKKEIELLKRENDLLKRENALLKRENASLKKGDTEKPTEGKGDSATRVTIDKVEYVYQGCVRNGRDVFVTVLATSKKGDHAAPGNTMTLVDDDGDKYVGITAGGVGGPVTLREGVPVKLRWRFGPNPFTGQSSAPSPKIARFTLVSLSAGGGFRAQPVEFRNVPAVVSSSKKK
jgi:hypothetical protein